MSVTLRGLMPSTRKQCKQRNEGRESQQERALRAVQMAASSCFPEDNRSLQESCLTICNSCRECVPWPCVRVANQVPSTLLAVFLPSILRAEGKGASRVLPPRQVLRVNWIFDDPATACLVEGNGKEEEKEDKGEEEEEEEEKADKSEEKLERGPLPNSDIDISKVRWPEGVKEIYFSGFNRPVDGVIWPDCLEVLAFHSRIRVTREMHFIDGTAGIFNKLLDGVTFPAGLREVFLGHDFNQRIDVVPWPEGLERLSMPGFNQPINGVQWPSGLKTLEFINPYEFERRESPEELPWDRRDGGFDQPLGSFLPMCLETLWLSDHFDQSLRGVTWPRGLVVLGLGTGITVESVRGVRWPPSVRTMVVADFFTFVLNPPVGCTVRLVEDTYSVIPDFDQYENGLDMWNDVLVHQFNSRKDSLDSACSL